MKSGTHSQQLPCVDYKVAKILKKMGFDEYTRASYIGSDFCDWMAWQNSRKISDKKWGFVDDKGNLRNHGGTKIISAPTLVAAARFLLGKTPYTVSATLDMSWEEYEGFIHDLINECES